MSVKIDGYMRCDIIDLIMYLIMFSYMLNHLFYYIMKTIMDYIMAYIMIALSGRSSLQKIGMKFLARRVCWLFAKSMKKGALFPCGTPNSLAGHRCHWAGLCPLDLPFLLNALLSRSIHPRHRPKPLLRSRTNRLRRLRLRRFVPHRTLPCPSGGWTPPSNAVGPAASLDAPSGRWRTRSPLFRWAGKMSFRAWGRSISFGRAWGTILHFPCTGQFRTGPQNSKLGFALSAHVRLAHMSRRCSLGLTQPLDEAA